MYRVGEELHLLSLEVGAKEKNNFMMLGGAPPVQLPQPGTAARISKFEIVRVQLNEIVSSNPTDADMMIIQATDRRSRPQPCSKSYRDTRRFTDPNILM